MTPPIGQAVEVIAGCNRGRALQGWQLLYSAGWAARGSGLAVTGGIYAKGMHQRRDDRGREDGQPPRSTRSPGY